MSVSGLEAAEPDLNGRLFARKPTDYTPTIEKNIIGLGVTT